MGIGNGWRDGKEGKEMAGKLSHCAAPCMHLWHNTKIKVT